MIALKLLVILISIYNVCGVRDEPADLLAEAAFSNFDRVHELLDEGLNPNLKDTTGYTPMIYAVKSNRLDTVTKLLEAGADPDMQENDGWCALLFAVVSRNMNMIQLLAEHGANPFVENDKNMSPMKYCSDNEENGMLSMLQASLPVYEKYKEEREAKRKMGKKLLLSAKEGAIDDLKELIGMGVALDTKDMHGWTALTYASGVGNVECVKMLLEANANPNIEENDGWTPIMFAAYRGHDDIVDLLAFAGASFVSRTKTSVTVLGASKLNSNRKKDLHHKIANHALFEGLKLGDQDICVEAVDEGAELDIENGIGWNALILFVYHGYERIVKRMMTYISNVNHTYNINKDDVISHQENDGWTALMFAASNGRLDIVQVLIANGADINQLNFKGESALTITRIDNQKEIEEYLLSLPDIDTSERSNEEKARLGLEAQQRYIKKRKMYVDIEDQHRDRYKHFDKFTTGSIGHIVDDYKQNEMENDNGYNKDSHSDSDSSSSSSDGSSSSSSSDGSSSGSSSSGSSSSDNTNSSGVFGFFKSLF